MTKIVYFFQKLFFAQHIKASCKSFRDEKKGRLDLDMDDKIMYQKVRSEYTANLCANAIGQYIFSSILKLSKNEIREWFDAQRTYYHNLMMELRLKLLEKLLILISIIYLTMLKVNPLTLLIKN